MEAGETPPPPPGNLTPDRERVVFSAGGASSSDTRTLTLTNTGNETVSVSGLSIGGEDKAQFSLADASAFTLEPGDSRALELTFSPSVLGPQQATLTITSDDSASGTLVIPLGGLGVEGQGGNLEPSLQWILDTYGLGIDTGDDDPSSTPLVNAPTNGLIGDEVAVEIFEKAPGAAEVSVQVLATFGVENDPVLEFGTYTAGLPSTERKLFDVQQTPTLNAQRLAPEVDATVPVGKDGLLTFDPGTSAFGIYSYWPTNQFFSERTVYSEGDLNTFAGAIPKQVRAYPLQEADGSTAYVLATEEFTQGFDYNDVVIILRGVVPGDGGPEVPGGPDVTGLEVRNTLGQPYPDRLVLQQIRNTSGSLCNDIDPDACPGLEQWEDIVFRNTGVLELENTGSSALQLSLSVADSNLFVLPRGEDTLSLAPGESYELAVEFAANGLSSKGVYPSVLSIQAGNQVTNVELAGIFMTKPEARREVFLEGLVNDAFGYDIDLGTNSSGGLSSSSPDSALAGEEVRSAYWEAADPGQPVVAVQIAAFHGCCRAGDPFEFWAQGAGSALARMVHDRVYGQSIYPSLPGQSGPATLSADISGPFEIRIAGYSTDPSKGRGNGNLGVRLWPLRDREGDPVEDTYLVVQDFVEQGCGTSDKANCDYNDSMFIVSNLEPVD